MNKLQKNLLSSLMGVLLMGSFASTQASQVALVASPQKIVTALKVLVQYVPSKELIAQFSKSMLVQGKSLLTFRNAKNIFYNFLIANGLREIFSSLSSETPAFKKIHTLLNHRMIKFGLSAAGTFAFYKMSSNQIKSFIVLFSLFCLTIDKFNSVRVINKQEQELVLVLARKKIQEKNEYTQQDLEKFSIQVTEKINKKLLQQASSIARLHSDMQNQETLHKLKVDNLLSQLEEVKKQRELLQQELATLNDNLSVELNLADQEICSLVEKIKILQDEKNALANALTALEDEWTINIALNEVIVDESLESDSKSTTPVNGSEGSDSGNQESSEESSDQAALSETASESSEIFVEERVKSTDGASSFVDSAIISF